MSNLQVKNSIKVWWEESRRESNRTARFLLLWMCFNRWLAHESGEKTDRKMINWLKQQSPSSSDLIECFERCKVKNNFVDNLGFLATNSPYKDARGKQEITVKDKYDFDNILEAIYMIRCNLSHGGTDPLDEESKKHLALAFDILNEWVATLNNKINNP